MVMSFECEKCKGDVDFKNRVQIIDDLGFTHTYCKACGQASKDKLDKRNSSIKESGKSKYF